MSLRTGSRARGDELRVLRALGALLTYPRAELIAALPEIGAVVEASALLPAPARERVAALLAELGATDPLLLEERYVELFDRGRSTSLNLFEHVHGESRDRGTAMVDLLGIYKRAGLDLAGNELPDYLPVLLEYLSCRDSREARDMLEDCAHILRRIGEVLAQRGSRYAGVLEAVLAAVRLPGLDWSRATEPAPVEPPIDEEWMDAPAFDGPGASGSGPAAAGGGAAVKASGALPARRATAPGGEAATAVLHFVPPKAAPRKPGTR
jgi:nitrate reductase delta subunit